MDRGVLEESESRFTAFIGSLNEVIGHRDRMGPLRHYCAGLLAGCERKSVEPLAAITAPARVSAQHQSLLHFVGKAPWSDEAVLGKLREVTLPMLEKHGPVEALIVDDTGFPKKGKHSVGVARQYCGQLGKQDNCQIAVSLSVANRHASLPIAYRLYLPQDWANDEGGRQRAGVPEDVKFQTKPEIALEQIAKAHEDGVPQGVVLMDAGYGVNTALREGVTALGLSYAAGILPQTSVWAEGEGPLPPKSLTATAATKTHAPRRRASAFICQRTCLEFAEVGLENNRLAGGHLRPPVLAFRAGPRLSRPSRLRSDRAKARRMASDRMAGGGSRNQRNTGSPPFRKTSALLRLST